eukprot:scaffold4745_cov125-Isochrysis_galbana.AAC.12
MCGAQRDAAHRGQKRPQFRARIRHPRNYHGNIMGTVSPMLVSYTHSKRDRRRTLLPRGRAGPRAQRGAHWRRAPTWKHWATSPSFSSGGGANAVLQYRNCGSKAAVTALRNQACGQERATSPGLPPLHRTRQGSGQDAADAHAGGASRVPAGPAALAAAASSAGRRQSQL